MMTALTVDRTLIKEKTSPASYEFQFAALKAAQCAVPKLEAIVPGMKIVASAERDSKGSGWFAVLQVSGVLCRVTKEACQGCVTIAVDADFNPIYDVYSCPKTGTGGRLEDPVSVPFLVGRQNRQENEVTVTRYFDPQGAAVLEMIR